MFATLTALLAHTLSATPACDPASLQKTLEGFESPFGKHGIVAAAGIAEGCPGMPKDVRTTLEAIAHAAPTDRDFIVRQALGRPGSDVRRIAEAGCRSMDDALAKASAQRFAIIEHCGDALKGWATRDELDSASAEMGISTLVFAPLLFHWMVEKGTDSAQAREVTRALAGIPPAQGKRPQASKDQKGPRSISINARDIVAKPQPEQESAAPTDGEIEVTTQGKTRKFKVRGIGAGKGTGSPPQEEKQ